MEEDWALSHSSFQSEGGKMTQPKKCHHAFSETYEQVLISAK